MSNPQLVGLINQTHAVKLLNQYRNLAYLICPSWYIPEGPDDVHQLRNSGAFNFIAETKGVWSAHHNGYALNISSETKGVVQLQWYIKHSRVLLGTVRIDTL